MKIFRRINYFGHKIKLRTLYFSEISYALDSENIPKDEVHRLEKIMQELPFGPNFASTRELIESFVDIRFPGYGSFYANQLHSLPGQKLELMSIVIPRTGKDRYFVLEELSNGELKVVADFTNIAEAIVRVRERNGFLEFQSPSDDIIFAISRKPEA